MEQGSGRVMLVVPLAIERAGLRTIIESSSLHQVVAEASSGNAAVQMAAETEPDIAVVDDSVPDTTGLGLARMLKRNYPRTSILFYCDCTTEELILHAMREGVRGFVLKTAAAPHLVPALDALSDHRPYWDDAVDEEVFARLMGGPPVPPDNLTPRERQVMHFVARGLSTRVIAYLLDVSPATIRRCRTALRRKLRLRNATDIVSYALEHRIIEA